MILLDGHSLTPKRRIVPEALSLTLKERDSTASMTPDSLSGISTKSWFLDETNPGKGIVWRVRSIGNAYATETPTIELEHVINTLKDRILFGEVTPEMMGGGEKCTALQAVRYILGKQSDWKLGAFGYSVSNPYKFDGDSLFDALVSVTKSLKDPVWTYDMSAYPFTLNIGPRSATVGTELRTGRNLVSITRTQDLSNTYTRFYPIGKDDLHIAGNYVERNTDAYGVIEHVEVNSSLETEAELRRWANEKLDVHAQPNDTIEIDALELVEATGETLDRLRIGRVCRVPMPDYGTTIEEKITEIRYADKLHQPEVCTVTLANEQEDIAQVIADAIKEGAGPCGSGGRGGARQDKEDHAWFEDTDTHVAMVAEGIVGTDKDGNPDWARLSQIVVDGEGIHQSVEVIKDDLGSQKATIEVTEKSINQVVEAVGVDGKVTAASICLAINNGTSEATINASRIRLLGKTIADTITADFIQSRIGLMNSLRVKKLTVANSISFEGSGTVITGAQAADIIRNLKIELSGNTYKLQKITCGDGTWQDVGSFSRAVSSWSVGGGGGKVNVTANPQNQTKSVNISVGGPNSIGSNGTFTYKAYYENLDGDDVETGASETVTVNIQPSNVQRKSSGISGTSLGNFSSVTGNYITFSVGGYNYYVRIG